MSRNICICLSHKVCDDFKLSKDSYLRIEKACSVFFQESSIYLVTTGWSYKMGMQESLSRMMANIAKIILIF